MLLKNVKMLSNRSISFDYVRKNGNINNIIAINNYFEANNYKGIYISSDILLNLNSIEFKEIYSTCKKLFNQVEVYKTYINNLNNLDYKKIKLNKFDIINKNLVKYKKYKEVDYEKFFNSVIENI